MVEAGDDLPKTGGGRMIFPLHSAVRILELRGTVSEATYTIDASRADPKGYIGLTEVGTSKQILVHGRRILPLPVDGKAVVIESGEKYRAICPKCGHVANVVPADDKLTCPSHGTFELYWKAKPMSTETTTPTETAEATPVKTVRTKKPPVEKKAKAPKAPKEHVKLDMHALKQIGELWTKGNVKFDHVGVDVKAHALIIDDGENSRKLCFNTYNGSLGKKSRELAIEAFKDGTTTKGEKPQWFRVEDIAKLREQLKKNEYSKSH